MDVFIFGSGFSKDLAGLSTLKDLSQKVYDRCSSPNTKELEIVYRIFQSLPKEITDNIELVMTMLKVGTPWKDIAESSIRKGSFQAVSSLVSELIIEEEKTFLDSVGEDHNSWLNLEKLVNHWNANNSKVITFNYDTLIERKVLLVLKNKRDRRVSLSNIYSGPFTNLLQRTVGVMAAENEKYFNLIKLHGSTNWFYSGNENFSGEPIYYDPFLEADPTSTAISEANKIDLSPLIIPPLLDKNPYMNHSLLRHQWKEAYKAIEQAENVYILGYSLPETDLASKIMLHEALENSNAKLNVFLHHSDQEVTREKFLKLKEDCNIQVTQENNSSIAALCKTLC